MMRKIIFKICGIMCLMAMFAAQVSAQTMCAWKAYQPELPKALRDAEDDIRD